MNGKNAALAKIIRYQKPDGSWLYPNPKTHIRSKTDYDQLETYRNLGILIEIYGLNKKHPSIRKAAEYLFSFQTKEGDFRGIYGHQYTPNYSAAITELLIKAGYDNDKRILKSLDWLMQMRQDDGGWAIPMRTQGANLSAIKNPKLLEPDRKKPFSWLVTGVVLRAFAAHSKYKKSKAVRGAGELLLSKFFKPDNYPDRKSASFWTSFRFPFWFTDLVSALDSLSRIGFSADEPQIKKSVDWLISKKSADGVWHLKTVASKNKQEDLLITRTIHKIFRRLKVGQ